MSIPADVTILDTVTGVTGKDDYFSAYWWAEGNGSCDCNRYYPCGVDDPNGGKSHTYCNGCTRFLIVFCKHPDGYSYEEFNRDYPKELLDKHRPVSFTEVSNDG